MHRQTATAFLLLLNTVEFMGFTDLAKRSPISPVILPAATSQQTPEINRPKISLKFYNEIRDYSRDNPTGQYPLPFDPSVDDMAPYLDAPKGWDLHYQVKLVTKNQKQFIDGKEAFMNIMADAGAVDIIWDIAGYTITEVCEYDMIGNPVIYHNYEKGDFHGEITYTYRICSWLFKPVDDPNEDPILRERRIRVSRDFDLETWNYYSNLDAEELPGL